MGSRGALENDVARVHLGKRFRFLLGVSCPAWQQSTENMHATLTLPAGLAHLVEITSIRIVVSSHHVDISLECRLGHYLH